MDLHDLLERWLDYQGQFVTRKTARQRRAQLTRAFAHLALATTADLDDLARLDDGLLALRRAGASVQHLRRCYQQPLRQLSAWLARHGRYLPVDPLQDWAPFGRLDADPPPPRRRAFTPREVARALLALERLHTLHGRQHPLRPALVSLLVAGPRVSRLLALRVGDVCLEQRRLALGPGRGRKRTGAAALDGQTLAEVLTAVATRGAYDDPTARLFVSPQGLPLRKDRLLDWWREAWGLARLEAIWPPDEPTSLQLLHLVNRCLLTGRAPIDRGGHPGPEARARRDRLARRVEALAARLEPAWREGLVGVDLHSLRKTHRTWAEAQGVAPIVIDKQLGHRGDADGSDLTRLLAGSRSGRHFYLDVDFARFDPRRSAEAVRAVLDEAERSVRAAGGLLVLPPAA